MVNSCLFLCWTWKWHLCTNTRGNSSLIALFMPFCPSQTIAAGWPFSCDKQACQCKYVSRSTNVQKMTFSTVLTNNSTHPSSNIYPSMMITLSLIDRFFGSIPWSQKSVNQRCNVLTDTQYWVAKYPNSFFPSNHSWNIFFLFRDRKSGLFFVCEIPQTAHLYRCVPAAVVPDFLSFVPHATQYFFSYHNPDLAL